MVGHLFGFPLLHALKFIFYLFVAAERSLELKLEEHLLTAAREGDVSELKKLVSLNYIIVIFIVMINHVILLSFVFYRLTVYILQTLTAKMHWGTHLFTVLPTGWEIKSQLIKFLSYCRCQTLRTGRSVIVFPYCGLAEILSYALTQH